MTKSKDHTPPKKGFFNSQEDTEKEKKEKGNIFDDLDIIENPFDESQDLNFPKASDFNINDPIKSDNRIP